jgi:hypothetical protein
LLFVNDTINKKKAILPWDFDFYLISEHWSIGVMEYWSTGRKAGDLIATLQYSSTPQSIDSWTASNPRYSLLGVKAPFVKSLDKRESYKAKIC